MVTVSRFILVLSIAAVSSLSAPAILAESAQPTPAKLVKTVGASAIYEAAQASVNVMTKAADAVQQSATLDQAHEQWLAGAANAAAGFGCTSVAVEQQPSETVADAISVFLAKGDEGSCLVLAPISVDTSVVRYSFAWGGNVNGIDIYYLSDVGKLRIWRGAVSHY